MPDPAPTSAGILSPEPGESLLSRMMRVFMLVVLIPSAVIPLLALAYLYRESLENQMEDGQDRVQQKSVYLEHFLDSRAVKTLVASQFPEVRTLANATDPQSRAQATESLSYRMNTYLRAHREDFSGLRFVDIKGRQLLGMRFDMNGDVIPYTDGVRNFSNQPWFIGANHLAAIQGKRTPVYFSHENVEAPVRFSTVVVNDEGVLFGVLVLEMRMSTLLRELTPEEPGIVCAILDASGNPLHPTDPGRLCPSLTPERIQDALQQPRGTLKPEGLFPKKIHVFARIQPRGQSAIRWTLIYDLPMTGTASSFQKALNWILLATAVSVGVAFLLVWMLSRQFTSPILTLSTAARDISQGHWDTEIPTPRVQDETHTLTVAFSSMCRQLKSSQESLLENIEQLRSSEKQLYLGKERLQAILSAIGDAVIALDPEGQIQLLNPVAEQMLELKEPDGLHLPLGDVATIRDMAEDREGVLHLLQGTGGGPGLSTLQLTNRSGVEFLLEHSVSPIRAEEGQLRGWVLVLRDVRQIREQTEEQNRMEKLDSLGVLAGGIAHDFNNLLAVILGDLSLLGIQMDPGQPNRELVSHAGEAARKARDLTGQLMTFSKGGLPVKSTLDLENHVRESTAFVLHGSACTSVVEAEDGLYTVQVDAGQMHQVFHNLTLNAVQAMPKGGTVRIRLTNEELGESNSCGLPPGSYVRIECNDQGTGISPEHLPRIFDPYFTTKNKGTGLGLSSVHSILSSHGGHIGVSTSPAGTTFTLHLPVTEETGATPTPPVVTTPAEPVSHAKVLIMDDESGIRLTTRRILEHFGHTVVEASAGNEALERFRQAQEEGEPFDAVVLDLTIPGGMGGRAVFEHLKELQPDVVAIVTSGYSHDSTMAHYREIGFKGMVRKPFSLEELNEALNQALREGSSPDS